MNKRTFKDYLIQEDNTHLQHYPWQATSNEDLLKLPGWVKYDEERYDEPGGDVVIFHDHNTGELFLSGRINQNGYFEIHDDWPQIVDALLVEHGGKWYLPFRIKEWKNDKRDDDLHLNDLKLSSFIGFPDTIKGSLTVTNCPDLSVEGCPSIIGNSVAWWHMPITNHIDKVFKKVGRSILLPQHYTGFLSFFKIKHLKQVKMINLLTKPTKEIVAAVDIVNDYLIDKNFDMLACQIELIEKGLEEYAML